MAAGGGDIGFGDSEMTGQSEAVAGEDARGFFENFYAGKGVDLGGEDLQDLVEDAEADSWE